MIFQRLGGIYVYPPTRSCLDQPLDALVRSYREQSIRIYVLKSPRLRLSSCSFPRQHYFTLAAMSSSHPLSKILSSFYIVIVLQIGACTCYTFRNCAGFPTVKSSVLEALNFAEYGTWRLSAGNDPAVNPNVVHALLGPNGATQFMGR